MITINILVYYIILITAVLLLAVQFTIPLIIRKRKSQAINYILNDMLSDLLDKFDMPMITHVEIGDCKEKIMSRLQSEDLLKYIGNIYVRKSHNEIYASYNIGSICYYVIVSDSDTTSQ